MPSAITSTPHHHRPLYVMLTILPKRHSRPAGRQSEQELQPEMVPGGLNRTLAVLALRAHGCAANLLLRGLGAGSRLESQTRITVVSLFILIPTINVLPQLPMGLYNEEWNDDRNRIIISILSTLVIIYLVKVVDKERKKSGLRKLWYMQLERLEEDQQIYTGLLEGVLLNFEAVGTDVRNYFGPKFYTKYIEHVRMLLPIVRNEEKKQNGDIRQLADSIYSQLRELINGV